ncbi:MAG: hypothetical protein ACYTG4_16405, partial [Planctomycetota bacterium]
SGYAIGTEALRRVARNADGRAQATNLRNAILEHLGLATVDGLVQWASGADKGEVASLVPVVEAASSAGDGVAGEILVHAIEELEGHVLTILTNLGPWQRPPELALGGGLLLPGRPLREPLERVLEQHHLTPLDRELDGALGAARLAMTGGRAQEG